MTKKIIVWLKNDLRVRDNILISRAAEKGLVFPVYCFDPRHFQKNKSGLPKMGSFRAEFLRASVANLRKNLKNLGSDLIIWQGLPEKIIPQLVVSLQADAVYTSKEITYEELSVESALENNLFKEGVALELFWQSTLLHIDDIPWPINNLPDIFTQFRKETERSTPVRKTTSMPAQLNPVGDIIPGEIPSLENLGLEIPIADEREVMKFTGGEDAAWERMQAYFWEGDHLKVYKKTRNGLLGDNYSSKLSPWLANGSISPRSVYEEVKKYEDERAKNESTYWLIFELLWRDYFKFVAKKYGNNIFKTEGIQETQIKLNDDKQAFGRWKNGSTGIPFIDANMRELNATGYMSNRGRQNVASFLTKDLQVNWTWGAAYFESQLIDYDVCSNWGNWSYLAGVGNDPRENRYFNIMSQAMRYDPQGDYVRLWLPELAQIKGKKIHYPAELTEAELLEANVRIGKTYPLPMVDFQKWLY